MMGNLQIIKTRWRITCLQAVLLISTCGTSQNLVLNPGFESLNQSALACGGYGTAAQFTAAINDWTWPNFGTSDIFSTTMPLNCFSNPTNPSALFGLQAPRTGNAMLGFANHIQSNMPCPGREYIQGNLSSPLIAGTIYNISFYVSLGDKCNIACNNFGVKFSTGLTNAANFCIQTTPDVNYAGPPVTNKTGWTKMEFCYTPQVSGLQHFIIGNFLSNNATAATSLPGTIPFSYYFIDDVSIEPSTSQALSVTPDPVICSGSSATLSATGSTTYSWSPATGLALHTGSTVIASPSVTTVYKVTAAGSVCNAAANVTVFVTPRPSLQLAAPAPSVCAGESATLTVTGANSYTWSTGSVDPVITVSPQSTTMYSVSGANGSCTASATVEVGVMPTTSLQVNAAAPVCYGQSTTLTATGGTSYNWLPSDGITDPHASTVTVTPIPGTVYSVTGSGPGSCPQTKTITLTLYSSPHVDAGEDLVTTVDEPVTLYAKGNAELMFFSIPGGTITATQGNGLTVNPSETSCYVLKGMNSYGCHHEDTVCVKVMDNYSMYVPNTFTPDGDGINDLFAPVCYGFTEIQFSVFNRWGTLIYSGNEHSNGWDGSYKGLPCAEGVYVYRIDAKTTAAKEVTRTGHVTLLTKSGPSSR